MSDIIIIISGSPSDTSKTKKVLDYLGTILELEGFSIKHISVKDVSKDVLFDGAYDSPEIRDIAILIQNAKGVIIGSPVYKDAYSGVLKTLIDVLPQDVLEHKPVLPLMTGGSSTHLLALDYTLKPVLASLKAHNLKGLYFIDAQIDKQSEIPINDVDTLKRTKKQLYYFMELAK
ncbi:NADPH-dependent FMN reductase [Planococcus sp. CPCC 101016]|uniref:NADPH-dependent FMN reductase n=1 Tax=Planococcus sp. CPCC 101016 TaxID=2599617 RepID=UPI0011B3833C|nr:NADPH-dependent FMN reductase [Planococcus sp. CPCC 101016]TWT07674.1 NADPH-dependent FMN reductase [Planococcus sp. CPCC 101016]